jgi:hypothetical protein
MTTPDATGLNPPALGTAGLGTAGLGTAGLELPGLGMSGLGTAGLELRDGMPGARVYLVGVEHGGDGIDLDRVTPPETVEQVDEVLVLARTPADLRRAATLHKLLPEALRVVVAVLDVPASHPAPVPVPTPAHRWLALSDLRVHRPATGVWVVDARFAAFTPAGLTVAATARAFAGRRLDAIGAPVVALAGDGAAHWRPGDPNATFTRAADQLPDTPAADLTLQTLDGHPDKARALDGRSGVRVGRPTVGAASWERLGRPGGAGLALSDPDVLAEPSMVAPVDERLVNPRGFVAAPTLGIADLTARDGRWAVVLDGEVLTAFARPGGVTDADVDRVRALRGIRIDWRHAHSGPLAAVRVLAGLAAAGVPLVADEVPRWAGALGDGLIKLITACPDISNDLRREEHSVRLRREALRTHGVTARWEQLGAPPSTPPSTSVLLTTRRPDRLAHALNQLARQRDARLEVILALRGVPRDHPEAAAAIRSFKGRLTVFETDTAQAPGEVLNQAAARASGDFLLRIDDTDWYGPDFVSDLLLAHAYTGAQAVGTVPEYAYLKTLGVTVHNRQLTEQFADSVADGTLLTERSAFRATGGFRPAGDRFQESLQAAGGQLYRAHSLNYIQNGPTAGRPTATYLQKNTNQWRGFHPSALMSQPSATPTTPGVR